MANAMEKLTLVDTLIREHGWGLQCWSDNLGRGVYALIGPNILALDGVREILDGLENESIPFGLFLSERGSWLPIRNAKSMCEALTDLNEQLGALPQEQIGRYTMWSTAVCDAYYFLTENKGALEEVLDREQVLAAPNT